MKKLINLSVTLCLCLVSLMQGHAASADDAALNAYMWMSGKWLWQSVDYYDGGVQSYSMNVSTPEETDADYGKILNISGFNGFSDLSATMEFNYDEDTKAVSLYIPYGQILGQFYFAGYGDCDVVLYGVDGSYLLDEGGISAAVDADFANITFEGNPTVIYAAEQNGEYIGVWDACSDISLTRETYLNTDYENMTFEILDPYKRTCILTKAGNATGDFVIPSTVNLVGARYNVTAVASYAFQDCEELSTVTLPETLEKIEIRAFFGCSALTEIKIAEENEYFTSIDGVLFTKDKKTLVMFPPGVQGAYEIPDTTLAIGEYAFDNCLYLTSLVISDSVLTIGNWSFFNCTRLSSLTIGNSVTSIGVAAFYYCSSLPSVTIPDSVTTIEYVAFNRSTNLSSVIFGNSVATVGDYAFSGCALTSVSLPASVQSIGTGAFQCLTLLEINVAEDNEYFTSVDGVLFSKDKTELLQYPCNREGAYEIPNTVTTVGTYAFLTGLNLTSLTIPESVNVIMDGAFQVCPRLAEIYVYAKVPPVCPDDYVFDGSNTDTCTLHVPVDTKGAYFTATGWRVFDNIIADLHSSGVDGVLNDVDGDDSDVVTVYNLQGVKMNVSSRDDLSTLPAGIYIVNGRKLRVK